MARLLVRTASPTCAAARCRPALVALILAAASATLALAVSLRAGAADPYEQDRARHQRGRRPCRRAPRRRIGAAALAHAPGVKAADGPFRLLGVRVRSRPIELQPRARGRRRAAPAIDRPKLTDGRWLSGAPGELVLDRPTARHRGVHVGQRLTVLLHDRRTALTVVGIAVSAGRDRSWVSEGDARRAAARRRSASAACSSSSSPTATRAAPSSTTCAAATRPISSTPTTGATIARRSPTGPRRRPSCSAARAWPPCSRSASSSPTRSAGGSSPRAATSACSRRPASRRAGSRPCSWSRTSIVAWRGEHRRHRRSGSRSARSCCSRPPACWAPPRRAGCAAITVAAGVVGVVAVVCLFTALPAWRAGRLGVLEAIALGAHAA